MAWPTNINPHGANHTPALIGISSASDSVDYPLTIVPVAVDPATGAILVEGGGGSGGGGTNANLYTGQKTVNTSAVQISSSSNTLLNGMLIKAPSSNAGNIIVGLSGVTVTTGDILEPGETRGYAINNTNLLYIISAASTTDIVSFSAN